MAIDWASDRPKDGDDTPGHGDHDGHSDIEDDCVTADTPEDGKQDIVDRAPEEEPDGESPDAQAARQDSAPDHSKDVDSPPDREFEPPADIKRSDRAARPPGCLGGGLTVLPPSQSPRMRRSP